jgi:ATP-binding cassette subfamily B protein
VEFRDVTFRYHGAEQAALEKVSFSANCGEVTAIIGGTGSGKSTLAKLVPRFYDPDEGQVLIDGVDLRELRQEDLRSRIGYVPQKAILFSGTVEENIRVGREEASRGEVEKAATIAQAAEFIGEMEGGYEHVIDQGGLNVSGGQKQRLSMARALARRPEIYVFDDSFSALDFKTDAKLRAALHAEIGESTILVVAQRIGTVMDADRIIVLDEGRVVGIGKHRELLDTCPIYREIAASQLTEERIA